MSLRKEEVALLMECLEADTEPSNLEVKNEFSVIDGEDFD